MSKLPVQSDRSEPPQGWGWADWSGADEARAEWKAFPSNLRQNFRGKMEAQANGLKYGSPVRKEVFSLGKNDDGIAKVRMYKPNPGYRAYCFQDGPTWYISHFAKKHDGEHEDHVATAKRARAEHLQRKHEREKAQRLQELAKKWTRPR